MYPIALPATNRLIDSLPIKEKNHLIGQCDVVVWEFGEVLCLANEKITHIYFPISGFASLLVVVDSDHPLEVGLVGNEGMMGVNIVLGVETAYSQYIVQGAGTALSIPVNKFRKLLVNSPVLLTVLKHYIAVLLQQVTLAGVCLHFHTIESRLARSLLMTQDRSHKNEFYLTHAFLAQMLGVRRSGVSLAAQSLQRHHLIDYARGNIRVVDRAGLEKASCRCYLAMNDAYKQILN